MAVKAATEAYEQAGVSPKEVGVVELHDCFSTNELITYEALVSGRCACFSSSLQSIQFQFSSSLLLNSVPH